MSSELPRTSPPGARLAAFAAMVVVVLSPWPFASVDPFWWASAVATVLFVCTAGRAWACMSRARPISGVPRAFTIVATLLPLVALVALIPLPAGFVAALSPHTLETLSLAGVTGQATQRLSLFPPATVDAALLAAACAAVAWCVADASRSVRTANALLGIFVIGGVLIASFGIVQRLFDPVPQRMFFSVQLYEVVTPFGPYVNRNHFGGAMLLFMGAAVGMVGRALSEGRRGRAAVYVGAALLSFVALLATTSRGAVLGAGVLVVAFIVMADARVRRRLVLWGVALVCIALGGLALVGLFDELSGRLFTLYGRWQNRFLVQANALDVFSRFPLAGTGAGTFPWVFHVFHDIDDARHFSDAHSDWVQFLMETGVLGVAYGLALLLVVGRAARAALASSSAERWTVAGCASGLLGIVAHGFGETNLHVPSNALLTAACLGLLYGACLRALGGASSATTSGVDESTNVHTAPAGVATPSE